MLEPTLLGLITNNEQDFIVLPTMQLPLEADHNEYIFCGQKQNS